MKYINFVFSLFICSLFFSCGSDTYERELEKSKHENKETMRFELGLDLTLDGKNISALNCKNPIDNVRLEKILEEIEDNFFDESKLETAKELTLENCLTVYQITSILTYLDEYDRMEFVRFSYGRTSERHLFYKIKGMINEEQHEEFELLYQNSSTSQTKKQVKSREKTKEKTSEQDETESIENQSTCEGSSINDEKFEKVISAISEGHMADDKVKIAKRIISENCITVYQLIDILDIIQMPDEQVIFAKYAYKRVINKSDFCDVKKAIISPMHHVKITDFCKRKGINCESSGQLEDLFENAF
ncbi:DUF4476 domain-containing protein [Bernardetia sp. ABR2-2B]|uniref:DUF4476 domain-containing protein n=1 Tax=Bernardetia sp. ABR2-2B TaxID=3127472 RepID=UPI0030D35088